MLPHLCVFSIYFWVLLQLRVVWSSNAWATVKSFLAPGVLGTSWLGSPLSVVSIHPSFPAAASHIFFQSCIQVRPLAASKNCLCVRTPSEAKDGSSSFAGLCKKSGCWHLLHWSTFWYCRWSTSMAGMRLGFGIVQVGTLEGEMHGITHRLTMWKWFKSLSGKLFPEKQGQHLELA